MATHTFVPGSIMSPRNPEEESKEERLQRLPQPLNDYRSAANDKNNRHYPSTSSSTTDHPRNSSFTNALLHSLNNIQHHSYVSTDKPTEPSLDYVLPNASTPDDEDKYETESSLMYYSSPFGYDRENDSNIINNNMNNERENTSSTNASRLYTSASVRSITLVPVGSSYSLSRPGSSMDMQELLNNSNNNNNNNNNRYYRNQRTSSIGSNTGSGGGNNSVGPSLSSNAYQTVNDPSSPAFMVSHPKNRIISSSTTTMINNNSRYSNETKEYEATLTSLSQQTSATGWNGNFHRRRHSNPQNNPLSLHNPPYSTSQPLSTILTVDALDNNVFTITDADNTLPDNFDSPNEMSVEWDTTTTPVDKNTNQHTTNNGTGKNSITNTNNKNNSNISSNVMNYDPISTNPSQNIPSSIRNTRIQTEPPPLPFPLRLLPEHFKPFPYRASSNDLNNSRTGPNNKNEINISNSTNTRMNGNSLEKVSITSSLSAVGIATANHVTSVDEALRFLLHPIPKLEPVTIIRATITSLAIPGANGCTTYTFWYNPPPPLQPSDPVASPIMLMVANRTSTSINGPPCYIISLADSVLFPSASSSLSTTDSPLVPSTGVTLLSSTVPPISSLVPIARLRGTKNGDSYVLYDGGKRCKNILQTIDMYKDSNHSSTNNSSSNGTTGTSTVLPKSTTPTVTTTHVTKPVTHSRRHHRRGSLIGLSTANIAVGLNKLVHFAGWNKPTSSSSSSHESTPPHSTTIVHGVNHHVSSSMASSNSNERVNDTDNDDNEDIGLTPVSTLSSGAHTPTNNTTPNGSLVISSTGSNTNTFFTSHIQLGHVSFETDINYGMSVSALEKLGISRSREDNEGNHGSSNGSTMRKRGPMVVAIPGVKAVTSKSKENTTPTDSTNQVTTGNSNTNTATNTSNIPVPSSTVAIMNKTQYALWPWPRWETGLPSHLMNPSYRTLINSWYAGLPDVLHQWRYDSFTVGYRHSGQIYILAGTQVPTLSPLYDSKYAVGNENNNNNINSTTVPNSNVFIPKNELSTATYIHRPSTRFTRSASAKNVSSLLNDSSSLNDNNSSNSSATKHFTTGMNFCLRDATFTGPSVFMQNDTPLSLSSTGIQPNFHINRSLQLPLTSSSSGTTETGGSSSSSTNMLQKNNNRYTTVPVHSSIVMENYQDSYLFVRQSGRNTTSLRLDITIRYPLSLVQAFGIILARIDTLTNSNDKK